MNAQNAQRQVICSSEYKTVFIQKVIVTILSLLVFRPAKDTKVEVDRTVCQQVQWVWQGWQAGGGR